jgi:trimethylamine---corrinoid protein Co-methyltransferase
LGRAAIHMWSAEECQIVHEATLAVLERAGVEVMYEPALAYYRKAGAQVDGSRVRLDRRVIGEALASAPRSWLVHSRGRDELLELKDGNTYFGTGSDCLYISDPDTHQRRRSTLQDVEDLCVLCERLNNIDFVMSMAFPEDLPPEVEVLSQHVAMLKGTRKPLLLTPRDGHQLGLMQEMAEVCGCGDSLMVYAMPSPPLMHDELALTKVMTCADLRIPLIYSPAPTAASTGPASVTGVVVTANAEVLSGLVLHQLVNPGAPFVYGAGCDTLDMRALVNPYVSPEWLIGCHAGRELAHFYGLPSFSYAAYSDSKLLDEQWSAETAMTAVVGALSRATLMHDVGYLESGMQVSYESVVLGDELVGFAKALLREYSVDDEALAVEEIISVGPGGHHLGTSYTRRHYRDFWVDALLDKSKHERWREAGATTLGQRVEMKVRALRESEPAFHLDEEQAGRLDAMLASVVVH